MQRNKQAYNLFDYWSKLSVLLVQSAYQEFITIEKNIRRVGHYSCMHALKASANRQLESGYVMIVNRDSVARATTSAFLLYYDNSDNVKLLFSATHMHALNGALNRMLKPSHARYIQRQCGHLAVSGRSLKRLCGMTSRKSVVRSSEHSSCRE